MSYVRLSVLIVMVSLSLPSHSKGDPKMNKLLTECPDCNIIIFSYSAFKASRSLFYGHGRETDKEARKYITDGIVFDSHYTVSNWPFQAQVSMMTGQLPKTHKVYNNDFHNKLHYSKFGVQEDVIDANEATLPEMAKKHGYHTFFVGGEPHKSFFSPKVGFTRGVDSYHPDCLHYHQDNKVIQKFIREAKDKKFFGIFHSVRTHFPHFLLPGDYKTDLVDYNYKGYFPSTEEDYVKEAASRWKDLNKFIETNPSLISSENLQRSFTRDAFWYLSLSRFIDGQKGMEHFLNIYDQSIRYTDYFVGQIFKELEEQKLLEKTIVIITSDTGDNGFEQYTFKNGSIYEQTFSYAMITPASARIPLIIYHPQLIKNKTGIIRQQQITNNTDLLPTISSLLGWQDKKVKIDGQDLLAEKPLTRKFSPSYTFRPHRGMELSYHNPDGTYLVNLRRKFYFNEKKKKIAIDAELKKLKDKNYLLLSKAASSEEKIVKENELNEMTKKIQWPQVNQSNREDEPKP
jgi:arylsulfatase A-like enzyme